MSSINRVVATFKKIPIFPNSKKSLFLVDCNVCIVRKKAEECVFASSLPPMQCIKYSVCRNVL